MGILNFLLGGKNKLQTSFNKEKQCCICLASLSGKIAQDEWGYWAHFHHSLQHCYSCHRFLSKHSSGGAYQYGDGRLTCGFCKKTAVTDGINVNKSKRRVLKVLEEVGFLSIPKDVEIVLSDGRQLSSNSRRANTAGLTLTRVHFSNHKKVGINHQIGVLYGLPLIEFEAVLAHELLHVWQNEHEFKLSKKYSEGLCELGSYLIYSGSKAELAKFLLEKMFNNKDPIYGDGFRLMHDKLKRMGWKRFVQDLHKNKKGYEGGLLRKIFWK